VLRRRLTKPAVARGKIANGLTSAARLVANDFRRAAPRVRTEKRGVSSQRIAEHITAAKFTRCDYLLAATLLQCLRLYCFARPFERLR
jgi:hypothetical protein